MTSADTSAADTSAADTSAADTSGADRAVRDTARALTRLLGEGRMVAPPADGRLGARVRALAVWGGQPLGLSRLVEGHLDALQVLREAGSPSAAGSYGVWASAAGGRPRASAGREGWTLAGPLRYCSGATFLCRALVLAQAEDGLRLFDVDAARARADGRLAVRRTWAAAGMMASDTQDVLLSGCPGRPVGAPGFYLGRPGFRHGALGVAAVWCGAVAALLEEVRDAMGARPWTEHQLAHLGLLESQRRAATALVTQTADDADATGRITELDVGCARSAAEHAACLAVERVPRITGPAGYAAGGPLGQRLVDLPVYVRQHHAEADHARLGGALLGGPAG